MSNEIRIKVPVKIGKWGQSAGWWRIRDAIAAGEPFSNSSGSFRGGPGQLAYPGRLSQVDWERGAAKADYVVWSYSTPIAWRTNGVWVTPAVKYSPTTSQHQGQAFTAIRELPAGEGVWS